MPTIRQWPDVAILSTAEAAVEYARAGFAVVPIEHGTKNAGSILGVGWPAKSSSDESAVRSWWREHPNAGIGLHTGASGIAVFDVDVDKLPDDLSALCEGLIHYTRANTESERGHYIFAASERYTAGAIVGAGGTRVGEIRSGNTIIVVEPTLHASGGRYHCPRPGEVPKLSGATRALLVPAPKAGSKDVRAFFAAYTGNEADNLSYCMPSAIGRYQRLVETGQKNRHDAMFDVLCLTMKEAHAQAYSAKEAATNLRQHWLASTAGDPNHDKAEFNRMLADSVAVANRDDPIKRREIMGRTYGTHTEQADKNWSAYERRRNPKVIEIDGKLYADPTADDDFFAGQLNTETDPSQPSKFDIDNEIRRLRKAAEAKRLLALNDWREPQDQPNLTDKLALAPETVDYLVDGLVPANSFVMVNAQAKAGKSTLVSVNLAAALACGDSFLGRFATHLDRADNVGVWNLEVSDDLLTNWLARLSLPKSATDRIYTHTARGDRSLDLSNPLAAEWAVKWLRKSNVRVWIIDPLSKLYRGDTNSNDEFNHWWLILEDIARAAELRAVVLVHHTGHSDDASDRSRGASAMMGNPDVFWIYRHAEPGKARPKGTQRWLEAFGRNVDVDEFEVAFDGATYTLTASGGGTRHDARRQSLAVDATMAVVRCGSLNTGQLHDELGIAKGKRSDELSSAIALAVENEWINRTSQGRSTVHTPGPKSAEITDDGLKRNLKVGDSK